MDRSGVIIPPTQVVPPSPRRPVAFGDHAPQARARAAPIVALAGAGGLTGRLLAAMLPQLARGRRVYCLDGGNLFDPWRLTELARAHGLDPEALLERVFVSRAYTCYQLLEAAQTIE